MFTDDERNEILTAFENLTDFEVEKLIRTSLLSKEEITSAKNSAIFDISGGDAEKEKDIRNFVDGGGSLPLKPSVWGGKYAWHLKELLEKKTLTKLQSVKGTMCQKVCVEFNYCEKRNSGVLESEKSTLIVAIADALITILTSIPLLAAGASYIIKNNILDQWCNCPKKASPPNNAN